MPVFLLRVENEIGIPFDLTRMLSVMEDVLMTCFFLLFSVIPVQRLFALSKESGINAAKFIIKQFPQYFDKISVQPDVPVSFLVLIFVGLCFVR